MFGKNLAEPASPFEQDTKKAAASSSSRSRHASSADKDGGIVHLGRKCLWLRAKESSVSSRSLMPARARISPRHTAFVHQLCLVAAASACGCASRNPLE